MQLEKGVAGGGVLNKSVRSSFNHKTNQMMCFRSLFRDVLVSEEETQDAASNTPHSFDAHRACRSVRLIYSILIYLCTLYNLEKTQFFFLEYTFHEIVLLADTSGLDIVMKRQRKKIMVVIKVKPNTIRV